MTHVSAASWIYGPRGWRFGERTVVRLVVLDGSSRSLFCDPDSGPRRLWLRWRTNSIRLPLDQLVRVVEGRSSRIAPGTFAFSWRGLALREHRDATGRVVQSSVCVDLVVPVERCGARVERRVVWVVMNTERLEIALDAIRKALPDAFPSGLLAERPTTEQMQMILDRLGEPESRVATLGWIGRSSSRRADRRGTSWTPRTVC